MKKLLIFSTLLLVTNTLFAQTYDYTAIVNSAEEKNKLEEYIEYSESGQVVFKSFKDKEGRLNGATIRYYENGNKRAEGMLKNNQYQGEWKYYWENGRRRAEGMYENDEPQGEFKYYLESGGHVNKTATYLNGVLHGPYREYYGNLSYKETGQYTNGKKDGIWKNFNENDQKEYKYYKDGNLYKIEFFYANSNIIMFEGDVTNGIGQMVSYTKAGKKESEGKADVTKDIRIGDWKYYDENGNLTKTETYKDGKVISTKTIEDEQEDFDIFGGILTYSTSSSDDDSNWENYINSPETIKGLQSLYMSEIKEMASYFGQDDTETYYFECYRDPNAGVLFFKTKYKKDKVYYNGKYYYDVLFEIQVLFKDINSVTQNGNKIHFNFNSNGYLRNVKLQGENWSGFVQNDYDFEITIYNDEKRKEALNAFKYLVEHPYKKD